ncbi:MAG TPA: His/Gly/Thr/Pro-type tRNA ligase C-terminal domain-containing protein, partial [Candidatus Limnocylindria bacterium]|nr:His/Gly/Thr/Pro-type tRNA ligase C-terminal domain-containing protein [Candidatus Limnocylindria bacterium]
AMAEALQMLDVYRQVAEDVLAIPVFPGRKSPGERFPGAVETFTIEGLMRDAKALQCGTSHFLGQNFGRAYDVTFLNAGGDQEHAWGTSWGFSTRMVGATIMAHGDEAGLRLPPAVAPIQVVIVPIYRSEDERASVISVAEGLRTDLVATGLRARVDDRDQHRPGFKFAEWELKGVPVRIELGPRDVAAGRAVLVSRLGVAKEEVPLGDVAAGMAGRLSAIQAALFADAVAFRDANTHAITSFDAFAAGVEERGGFWTGAWCGSADCEAEISAKTKATIRFLPIEPREPGGACMHCGRPGTEVATWARAY